MTLEVVGMNRWLIVPGLLAGLLALAACAAKEEAPPTTPAPEVKPAWEQEWGKVLAAAKQEGKVALITSVTGAEGRRALTEGFQKRYGIQVEYMGLKGGELGPRVQTERGAGQYLWDVTLGGTDTQLNSLRPLGALDPIDPALILPEVKEGQNWLGGKLEFADKDHLSLIPVSYSNSGFFVNTTLAKPGEFKSFKDLLDPKWKGKIIVHDPTIAGPSLTLFSLFHERKDLGPDFIRNLAKQDLRILRDTGQELEWLGQGRYPICLGCSNETAEGMMRQGVPIALVNPAQLKEGGYLSVGAGAVALMNRAPHPNAAKVFINWFLSREGQTEFNRAAAYASRRLDVPNQQWLDPEKLPRAEFWPNYDEAAVAVKEKVRPLLVEIIGQ